MLSGKMKVQSQNGGMILEGGLPVGHVLDARIVTGRGTIRNRVARDSRNAAHSLGRVPGRRSRSVSRSYFCPESINRWCTNAMLARSNARDRAAEVRRSIQRAECWTIRGRSCVESRGGLFNRFGDRDGSPLPKLIRPNGVSRPISLRPCV
jgi:hypothetical protein